MRLAWPNISKGLIIVKSMLTEVKSFELFSRIEQFLSEDEISCLGDFFSDKRFSHKHLYY